MSDQIKEVVETAKTAETTEKVQAPKNTKKNKSEVKKMSEVKTTTSVKTKVIAVIKKAKTGLLLAGGIAVGVAATIATQKIAKIVEENGADKDEVEFDEE